MLWIYLIIILIVVIWGGVTRWKFVNKNKQYFKDNYTINNVFDMVYVINLDKQPENLKDMDNKLKQNNIKYQRFKAIDGHKVIDQYNLPEDAFTYELPGVLGCLLSHRTVMEDALENDYNKILILEDDCIFKKDFKRHFNNQYNSIIQFDPNWKVLYFGTSQQYGWPDDIKYYKDFYIPKKGYSTFAYGLDKSIIKEEISKQEAIALYDEKNKKKNFSACLNFLVSHGVPSLKNKEKTKTREEGQR